jgi:hypothetical protein
MKELMGDAVSAVDYNPSLHACYRGLTAPGHCTVNQEVRVWSELSLSNDPLG